jgi:hypothetical protein
MSNLMLKKKNKKESSTDRTGTLGPDMSFLFVIQDACRRGGRYTLTAESKGLKYAVMVDRNGPFNVTGGGYTGSAALAMAAALRTGTYSMSEGWPELQPYYQLGLDTTLKTLLDGRARLDVEELPVARGVDWIRNAEGDPTPAYAPTPRDLPPGLETNTQPPAPPWPGSEAASAARPAPLSGASDHVAIHAIPAPAPAPVARPQAPVAAPGAPTPVTTPAPSPVAKAEPAPDRILAVRQRSGPDNAGADDAAELDALTPGASGTSEGQGPLKHLGTRALLWTIRMDDPARFNLNQALVLVGRSLRSDYGFLVRPVEREIIQRWRRAGEDWRTSGEAVSKQKLRKRAPGYVAKEK